MFLLYAITNDFKTTGYTYILQKLVDIGLDIQTAVFHCDYELAIVCAL